MNRRSVPPPPTELDALFLRLRREVADVRMDESFPARVEAAIRAREGRTLPGWAAVAAAVLLALGAGLLKGDRMATYAHGLPCLPTSAPCPDASRTPLPTEEGGGGPPAPSIPRRAP